MMKYSTLIVTLISVSSSTNNYYYATADNNNKLYQRELAKGKAGKKYQKNKKLHQCEMELDDVSRQLDEIKKENARLRAMLVVINDNDETTGSLGSPFSDVFDESGKCLMTTACDNNKDCRVPPILAL